ncbi:hypothetical protein V6N12_069333 [Hibiscus sabdariffa]|uniref:Uncharacterized protein n=1 Tax=Hibiscus sabdariffa TaxID=183260 RepID=A0ABR2FDI4_9ROSI
MSRAAFAVRNWNDEHRQGKNFWYDARSCFLYCVQDPIRWCPLAGRIEIGMEFMMLFRSIWWSGNMVSWILDDIDVQDGPFLIEQGCFPMVSFPMSAIAKDVRNFEEEHNLYSNIFSNAFFFNLTISMSNISSLMANLHFTEEDFENMESLHFEKEHQVEGSDKWIVGKVLAPAAVDHDMLIQVDSGKSKLDVVHRPKPSIVLTKKGVVAAATLVPTRDEGVVIARPMQTVMTTGVALSSSKIQSSKRTYSPKDAEGLAMVSKKARASGCNTWGLEYKNGNLGDVVRREAGLASFLPQGPFIRCHDWIQDVATLLDGEHFTYFVTLLWRLWNRRNKWIHDGKLVPARIVVDNVRTLLMDITSARLTDASQPSHTFSRFRSLDCCNVSCGGPIYSCLT